MSADCIFCRIVRGEIPCKKVYEDDDVFAFHDIHPVAPVHFLIVPKAHVPSMYEADMAHHRALGRMLALAGELARKEGATEGFRIIINTGRVAHQEVYHVHVHVLGGPESLGPMIVRKQRGA
ncbi:MAG: histidine triad nucleotide-binding protein [Burkholderiales bacterium]|nr:histidine triad nucleotide-binding protein [Burkholderiales bacterium]